MSRKTELLRRHLGLGQERESGGNQSERSKMEKDRAHSFLHFNVGNAGAFNGAVQFGTFTTNKNQSFFVKIKKGRGSLARSWKNGNKDGGQKGGGGGGSLISRLRLEISRSETK